MFRSLLFLLLAFFSSAAAAQTTSGIVNRYTSVIAIDTCISMLQVSDTSGFKKGDAIWVIQMQGAAIASTNNSAYGTIQSMHAAGLYERAVLDSVGDNALFIQRQLRHQYDILGKVQVVRIAVFHSVTVTDTVFARPWDGSTGGVLALEVSDTLTLLAPVLADGAGFRGGAATVVSGNNCNFLIPEAGYFYALGNWRGSNKGEGIALRETGKELGRGPQANGGGGGNDHNAGGGGGAHLSRGGTGGDNNEPSSFGCDGYYPGIGGYKMLDDALRIFPGGGGGAGHANNTLSGSGGNGGGIIFLQANIITGTGSIISASGRNAATADGDGGGGGGAGGTIWLQANEAPGDMLVRANGGNGGNTSNNNANRCFGPGGGGSGGRILTNLGNINIPAGGAPGIVTNSMNGCNGTSNNAGTGENGRVEAAPAIPQGTQALRPEILQQVQSDTVCLGESTIFYTKTNAGNWKYQWQRNDGSGWVDISLNANFSGVQDDTLILNNAAFVQSGWQLRCFIQRPGCFETYTAPANLAVIAAPVAAFSTDVNDAQVVFYNTSTGAESYQWDFGDGQYSNEVNPQHEYADEGAYTITLTVYNACESVSVTQQLSILLLPTADFSAPVSAVDCGPTAVQFENLSSLNSSSFSWLFPGGTPESSGSFAPTVIYASSGNYTATLIAANAAGADTLTQTIAVQVLDVIGANFSYTILPGGLVQCINTSTGDGSFTWDFGDGSPQVSSDSIVSHQYLTSGNYTLTLIASNACGASVFQQTINITVEVTGTSDQDEINAVLLYPNPLEDILVVDCSLLGLIPDQIQMVDMLGRTVFSQKEFSGVSTRILLPHLSSGLYWVQVRAGGMVKRRLMVKG